MWIRKLAKTCELVIDTLSKWLGILATAFVMSIMVLTVIDVLLRSIFNHPIIGSVELCEYFIVMGGFLGVAWCATKGGHVKVGMIIDRLSPRAQCIADVVNYVLAIIVIPLVSWRLFVQAGNVMAEDITSSNLEIPAFPFYYLASIGFGLLSLVVLVQLIKAIARLTARGGQTQS
jgi:TRAP-type transport system small permease protein